MNMYIYPKYLEEATKRHWVVRWLRYFGVIQVIAVMIAAVLFGAPYLSGVLKTSFSLPENTASALSLALTLLIGFSVGLSSSVATWALAMVVDDLHAMRQHSEAWVAFETDNPHLGK